MTYVATIVILLVLILALLLPDAEED